MVRKKEEKISWLRRKFRKSYTFEKSLRHHLLEWSATILSIGGAILNANQHIEGFYMWSVANFLWIIFGIKFKHWGLVIMNLVFLCINIFGVVTWWRNPFVIFG